MGDFKVLEGQDAESLEDPFLEEEVSFFFFLLELNGDKAVGLDGFLMAF